MTEEMGEPPKPQRMSRPLEEAMDVGV